LAGVVQTFWFRSKFVFGNIPNYDSKFPKCIGKFFEKPGILTEQRFFFSAAFKNVGEEQPSRNLKAGALAKRDIGARRKFSELAKSAKN
jgi:hypothetical protein